jgi:hypothetical protein
MTQSMTQPPQELSALELALVVGGAARRPGSQTRPPAR